MVADWSLYKKKKHQKKVWRISNLFTRNSFTCWFVIEPVDDSWTPRIHVANKMSRNNEKWLEEELCKRIFLLTVNSHNKINFFEKHFIIHGSGSHSITWNWILTKWLSINMLSRDFIHVCQQIYFWWRLIRSLNTNIHWPIFFIKQSCDWICVFNYMYAFHNPYDVEQRIHACHGYSTEIELWSISILFNVWRISMIYHHKQLHCRYCDFSLFPALHHTTTYSERMITETSAMTIIGYRTGFWLL